MSFNITFANAEDAVILRLTGRLTLGQPTSDLRNSVEQHIANGRSNIVLDMHALSRIDSAGLGEIVYARSAAARHGGVVRLLHLDRRSRDLMQMVKLHTVFESYDDEQQALASFRAAAA